MRGLLFLGLFSLAIGAGAQTKPSESPAKEKEKPKEDATKSAKEEFQPPPPLVTDHTVTLSNGKVLSYKAITGYLLIREAKSAKPPEEEEGPSEEPEKERAGEKIDLTKGKPKAEVFFVAYLLNGITDPATRPVTFTFNGGPGSSSVWLHVGALGPKRVLLSDRGEALPPPSKLVDNDSTWLDKSDLVFIDPVSTGYSRPAPGEEAKQFYGYKKDIESVGDFIRLWTTRYGRWSSPKIIAGESYGTARAAGLSAYLESRYGIYVNGIVLISSALNLQTIDMSPGNDAPFPFFLPSYTAAAWYHKRLSPDLEQLPLGEVLNQSEAFASGDYLLALSRGDTVSPTDLDRLANELAKFTGLDAAYLKQQNLREPDVRFFDDLLKDKNRSIGRLDARFTGIRLKPGTNDAKEFDPSGEAVFGSFASAFNDYVRRDLKFESDLPYETIAEVKPWTFSENKFLDVANNLKLAMSRHPYLKVWICCGYYDLATPYFAAESVIHGLNLDPAIRENVQFTFYEAGHMLYIEKGSREKFKSDFEQFLSKALSGAPVNNAER